MNPLQPENQVPAFQAPAPLPPDSQPPRGLDDHLPDLVFQYEMLEGTEQTVPINVVAQNLRLQTKQIAYLETQLAQNPGNEAIQSQLRFCHAMENLDHKIQREWIDTNRARIGLRQVADAALPSAPVNMNVQSFTSRDTAHHIQFIRMGAFYAPNDAGYSVDDLKVWLNTTPAKREVEQAQLNRRAQEYEQLADRTSNREKRDDHIRRAVCLRKEATILIPERLERRIKYHQAYVRDQMMQLVMNHAQLHGDQIQQLADGQTWPIFNLSLMNENLDKIDGSGFIHRERVMMEEMAWVFKEFQGKELVFDGKGPYMDSEGNLHMEQDLGGKRLKIQPVFMNLSVQGSRRIRETQEQINSESIALLLELLPPGDLQERARRLQERLDHHESSFDLANEFAVLAHKAGFPISLNCFSGKDRTGAQSSFLVDSTALKEAVEATVPQAERVNARLSQLSRRLFSKSGVAIHITYRNTETRVLKVMPWKMGQITHATIGKITRLHAYWDAARQMI